MCQANFFEPEDILATTSSTVNDWISECNISEMIWALWVKLSYYE